jgi:uncharacterized membrane protein YidH (DUF202 family)
MKKILLFTLACISLTSSFSPLTYAAGRFDNALEKSIVSLSGNIDTVAGNAILWWAEGISTSIVHVMKTVVLPLSIIIGVLTAILWLYEVFMSEKEEASKTGMNYIIWWVIGIIVMTSATFLADVIVNQWIFAYDTGGNLLGNVSAQRIYRKLIFPFVKLGMYLVMWVLFLIMLLRVGEFLQSPKDDIKTQAKTIIQWNAVGILVIIFAKKIIETIYGTEAQIVSKTATNLGQIGGGILAEKQIPYAYTILNRAMWFLGVFILIIIIVQAIKLLLNPTDEATQKSLRKSFLYIVIGLVIMATAYIVVNVLIVN